MLISLMSPEEKEQIRELLSAEVPKTKTHQEPHQSRRIRSFHFWTDDVQGGGSTFGPGFSIGWIGSESDGPGPEGATLVDIAEALADRMRFLLSDEPSESLQMALAHIQQAIGALNDADQCEEHQRIYNP